MKKKQWDRLEYYLKAWRLAQIMMYMNDEEAYYSGWLYIWPDGETYEECKTDFNDKESYQELLESFKFHYSEKEAHKAGLYSSRGVPKQVVEDAHMWDKELGLDPIEVVPPVEW